MQESCRANPLDGMNWNYQKIQMQEGAKWGHVSFNLPSCIEVEGGSAGFVAELREKGGGIKWKDTGKGEKRASQSNEWLERDTNSNREAQKTLKRGRNVEEAEGMYKHP